MAYLRANWPDEGQSHRYISRERLQALLETVPAGSLLVVNRVGSLAVMAGLSAEGDGYAEQLGWINIGGEVYEEYLTEDES